MPANSRYHQHLLLITGCARSGTLYTSKVFQSAGLDVRHEQPIAPNGVVGVHGIVSWLMAVDAPCPPYGPSACDHEFKWTIHQTRHPLSNIASAAQFILKRKVSWDYISQNIPDISQGKSCFELMIKSKKELVHVAMRYWLLWNQLAEVKSQLHVRVEDLLKELPGILNELGMASEELTSEIWSVSKQTNSRDLYVQDDKWSMNWNEMETIDGRLTEAIRLQAERYGYVL